MKKHVFLLLLVLGFSSTAWGYCYVNVNVDPVVCGDPVNAQVTLCCSGQCEFEDVQICRWGNVIYANVYLDCTCMNGCSQPPVPDIEVLDEACCGLYVVVVRVWCTYECWPYCMFGRPMICGMGSTAFRVCCDDGCCCFPCLPCCPSPGSNSVVFLR